MEKDSAIENSIKNSNKQKISQGGLLIKIILILKLRIFGIFEVVFNTTAQVNADDNSCFCFED